MEIGTVDILIVIGGWAAGNALFNGFEQHLPWYHRLAKLMAMLSLLTVVGVVAGRVAFYVLLSILGLGMTVLHAWVVSQEWRPLAHGRATEPIARPNRANKVRAASDRALNPARTGLNQRQSSRTSRRHHCSPTALGCSLG